MGQAVTCSSQESLRDSRGTQHQQFFSSWLPWSLWRGRSGGSRKSEMRIVMVGLDGSGKTAIRRYLTVGLGVAAASTEATVNGSKNVGDHTKLCISRADDDDDGTDDTFASPTKGFRISSVVVLSSLGIDYTCTFTESCLKLRSGVLKIISLWDIGGTESNRYLYRSYCPGADALIFVVDSTDVKRLGEACALLKSSLQVCLAESVPQRPHEVHMNENNKKLLIYLTKQDLASRTCGARTSSSGTCGPSCGAPTDDDKVDRQSATVTVSDLVAQLGLFVHSSPKDLRYQKYHHQQQKGWGDPEWGRVVSAKNDMRPSCQAESFDFVYKTDASSTATATATNPHTMIKVRVQPCCAVDWASFGIEEGLRWLSADHV